LVWRPWNSATLTLSILNYKDIALISTLTAMAQLPKILQKSPRATRRNTRETGNTQIRYLNETTRAV